VPVETATETVQLLDEQGQVLPGAELPELSDERLRELYQTMKLMRAIDKRLEGLQRMGRIGFFGSARGQEGVLPALRENGIMLLRGFDLSRYFAHMFGNEHDVLKGRMQPMHFAGRAVNQVSWSSCIASQLPHATGVAYAMKLKGDGRVAMGFVGDGGTSEPDFASALNFAGVWKAPAVFVIQNNQWAISIPVEKQTASESLAVKAVAFGIPGVRVDGNDVLAVYRECKRAVDRARSGDGPTLLELVTFRVGGHSSADDPSRYRDESLVQDWERRCPLLRFRAFLEGRGLWDETQEEACEVEQRQRLNAAVKEAEQAPPPAPTSLLEDVYSTPTPLLQQQRAQLEAELAEREQA